jgi:hypothetical protein
MHAGQVDEAIAEVEELRRSTTGSADRWYGLACFFAVASGKSADKRQEYADRAMELLQKAVKAGFRNVAHMARDSDLDGLRGRDDFKKLMRSLAIAKQKQSGGK